MQSSLLGIAEAKLILCKDNASRAQSSLLGIAEAKLILCKDNASRAQSSLLEIAEAKLILCKDKKNAFEKANFTGIFSFSKAFLRKSPENGLPLGN